MAAQCLRGRDDVAAAAGSPAFPCFDDGGGFHGASTVSSPCVDDGGGFDTVRALQHLQSRLARLDRERHDAEACSEVLREDIAARELRLEPLQSKNRVAAAAVVEERERWAARGGAGVDTRMEALDGHRASVVRRTLRLHTSNECCGL